MKKFFQFLSKFLDWIYSEETVEQKPVEKPVQYIPKEISPEEIKKNNLKAFLTMIAIAEGTNHLGDNGYNVMVGGRLFDSYEDHPNVLVDIPRYKIKSTAAGRYQILKRYWDHYKKQLNLPDFGPESQDKYAINQIKERKALNDVYEGRIVSAIDKCANIWASLPHSSGNLYGQRQVPVEKLLEFYVKAGGKLNYKDLEVYNK